MADQQEQKAPRPRDVMPNVWAEIAKYRGEWGDAYVSGCITRGMKGEPDWFYAFEGGHVAGTPFKADPVIVQHLHLAVSMGGRYAMVMRPPAEPQGAGAVK